MSEKEQDEQQMSFSPNRTGLNEDQSEKISTISKDNQFNGIHSTTPVKINSSTENSSEEANTNMSKRTSLPKTEAQIEYQKDQPLYKRQLSKSLDNSASAISRMKQIQESNSR